MDLKLTELQESIRDSLRTALSQTCTPEHVRQMEQDNRGYGTGVWSVLCGMGLPAMSIGEAYGGLGLGKQEEILVYEELGRALCPSPLFDTSGVVAQLLTRGTPDLAELWLPRIAVGEITFSLAWWEPHGSAGPAGVTTRAERTPEGLRLYGVKVGAMYAGSADRLVVTARTGTRPTDVDLFMVAPTARGVTLDHSATLAKSAQFAVHLDGAEVADAEVLTRDGQGWQMWSDVLLEARVLMAAWAVGCADRALEMASSYAQERVQFGRPIGSFQAIAHQIATVAVLVASSRLLVQEAAWGLDQGRGLTAVTAMAGSRPLDVACEATRVGQQVMGGIGFTDAVDMQLYFRRAREMQLMWSDRTQARDIIADRVLEGR